MVVMTVKGVILLVGSSVLEIFSMDDIMGIFHLVLLMVLITRIDIRGMMIHSTQLVYLVHYDHLLLSCLTSHVLVLIVLCIDSFRSN